MQFLSFYRIFTLRQPNCLFLWSFLFFFFFLSWFSWLKTKANAKKLITEFCFCFSFFFYALRSHPDYTKKKKKLLPCVQKNKQQQGRQFSRTFKHVDGTSVVISLVLLNHFWWFCNFRAPRSKNKSCFVALHSLLLFLKLKQDEEKKWKSSNGWGNYVKC